MLGSISVGDIVYIVIKSEFVAILVAGYSFALLSALTNNLPTVITVNLSIQEGLAQLLALVNLMGTNNPKK